MKMWIARDKQGMLAIFEDKPTYSHKTGDIWLTADFPFYIDKNNFPEVTFENSPMEVELVLPSQEPTIGDLLNQLMELNKEYKEFRMLVGLMRHAQTYGDKQSSFQESAVDHFIKTHNIDWD